MKPHLFLLLLIVASVFCNPLFSVDRPATAAAALPFKGVFNAARSTIKALHLQYNKSKKRENLQLQSQYNICRQVVQAYRSEENQGYPVAPALSEILKVLERSVNLPPFVKVCVDVVNRQLKNQEKNPNAG